MYLLVYEIGDPKHININYIIIWNKFKSLKNTGKETRLKFVSNILGMYIPKQDNIIKRIVKKMYITRLDKHRILKTYKEKSKKVKISMK